MARICENPGCENELTHHRADAHHCSAACRRAHYTLRRLQAGKPTAGYRTLDEFLKRRQRRGKVVA